MTKLYSSIPVWVNLTSFKVKRWQESWDLYSRSDVNLKEVIITFVMVNYLMKMTARNSCKYSGYGQFGCFALLISTSVAFRTSGEISAEHNPRKYTGGTACTPALTIKFLTTTDVGGYRCEAENDFGRGVGDIVMVNIVWGYTYRIILIDLKIYGTLQQVCDSSPICLRWQNSISRHSSQMFWPNFCQCLLLFYVLLTCAVLYQFIWPCPRVRATGLAMNRTCTVDFIHNL